MKPVTTKPWQLKEWQDKRKEIIANHPYCAQCGSKEDLVVHHPFQLLPHKLLFRLIALRRFDSETGGLQKDGCPACGSINIRARKTREPKYRCDRCYTTFEQPVTVKDTFTVRRAAFWDWVKKNREAIQKDVEEQRKRYWERYMSLEGTTVLCKKCNFLLHKRGMVLCKECKEKYHKQQYTTCYDCFKKTQAKE